jgi:hypothetical protein
MIKYASSFNLLSIELIQLEGKTSWFCFIENWICQRGERFEERYSDIFFRWFFRRFCTQTTIAKCDLHLMKIGQGLILSRLKFP